MTLFSLQVCGLVKIRLLINMTHSALLKMWFRGLPKPLIPESAINYMVQVKKAEPTQKIKMLHELYNELIVPGESSS